MSEQDDRERLRYLQLKQKASIASENPVIPQTPSADQNIVQKNLSIDPNASAGTQIAQGASSPFRGYRGAAVGLENIAEKAVPAYVTGGPYGAGKAILEQGPKALERASEAVKPGFKPENWRETLASGIGESVPLMPLGGAMSAGWKGVGLSGTIGAGTSALMQKSEKGEVSPGQVAFSGTLSALIPAIPLIFKKAWPAISGYSTKTSPEAFEKLMDDPKFMEKYAGTEEAIRQRADYLAKGFDEVDDKLNVAYNHLKETYGLNPTLKESLGVLEETSAKPRDINQIAQDFKEIKRLSAPTIRSRVASGLVDEAGKPLMKTIETKGLSERDQLSMLWDLDKDLNYQTGGQFKGQDMGSLSPHVKNLKQGIQESLYELPGGKILQNLRQRSSALFKIRDKLGQDLINPDTSAATLEKIVRGDIKGALSGHSEEVSIAIKELEKIGGLGPIMEPLRNEILSGMLKKPVSYVPRGTWGGLLLRYSPSLAVAETVSGSPRLMAGMVSPIRYASENAGKASVLVPGLLRGSQE